MTGTRQLTIIAVFYILFAIGSLNVSCTKIDARYFEKLDSLDMKIKQSEMALNIDTKTLSNREKLIFDHLRYINKFYDTTTLMTSDFSTDLAKYKAIKKNYTSFLKNYDNAVKQTKTLKSQAADLRKSVESGEMSKTDFKKYFALEMQNAETALRDATDLNQSIYGFEPEFQRISYEVEKVLNEIASKNPLLKSYLNQQATQ